MRTKPFEKPQCQDLKTLNQRSASWFCRWPRSEGPACSASLAAGWGELPRQMLLREMPQVTRDKREKVVTGLGHVAMTETQDDGPRQRSTGDTWSSVEEVEVTVHCECSWLHGEGLRVPTPAAAGGLWWRRRRGAGRGQAVKGDTTLPPEKT